MANPFDQFDAVPDDGHWHNTPKENTDLDQFMATKPAPNPFDKFDEPSPTAPAAPPEAANSNKPESSWLETGWDTIKQIPGSFQKAAGGLLRATGDSGISLPAGMEAGPNDPMADKLATFNAEVAKSPVSPSNIGKHISDEAEKAIAANAPNVPAGSAKHYANMLGLGISQMAPALLGTVLTHSAAPIVAQTAAMSFGNNYADAMNENPGNPDAAFSKAASLATVDTAAALISIKAFGIQPFSSAVGKITNEATGEFATVYQQTIGDMIKNVMVQGVAIQPAIGLVNRGVDNWINGRPLTEGFGDEYVTAAIQNTLVMGLTHMASKPPPTMGKVQGGEPGPGFGEGPIIDGNVTPPGGPQSPPGTPRLAAPIDPRDVQPGDEESPIDTSIIAAGRKIMRESAERTESDSILAKNGWPAAGTYIHLDEPRYLNHNEGTVDSGFTAPHPDIPGASADALRVRLDNGIMFEAFRHDLDNFNVKITPQQAQQAGLPLDIATAPTDQAQPQAATAIPTPAAPATQPEITPAQATPQSVSADMAVINGNAPISAPDAENTAPNLRTPTVATVAQPEPAGGIANSPKNSGDTYTPPATKPSFAEHVASVRAAAAATNKAVADAFGADGRVVGSRQDNPNQKLLLTRGTDEAPFRVTSLDEHGPSGHRDYNSLEEAANEFRGKVNIEPPKANATQTANTYAPMLRPASFATLPHGLKWEYTEAPKYVTRRPDLPQSSMPHGVIKTERPLTADEQAQFDIKPYEAAAPKATLKTPRAPLAPSTETSVLENIRRMGGIRTTDANGQATKEGQDIAAVLKDVNRPGLINNNSGVRPDTIREAMQEHGWFGQTGGHDIQDLYDLIDKEVREGPQFHPESERGRAVAEKAAQEDSDRHQADAQAELAHFIKESKTIFSSAELATMRTKVANNFDPASAVAETIERHAMRDNYEDHATAPHPDYAAALEPDPEREGAVAEGARDGGEGHAPIAGETGEGGEAGGTAPAPVEPAGEAPAEVKPPAPRAPRVKLSVVEKLAQKRPLKESERRALLDAYYKPGRTVQGYGGIDRVTHAPKFEADGRWEVGVREVGSDGVTLGRQRFHSTAPGSKALLDFAKTDPAFGGVAPTEAAAPKFSPSRDKPFHAEPGPAVDGHGKAVLQTVIPGTETDALQLAAAREAVGKGKSTTKVAQKEPGGLFGESETKEPEQGRLFRPEGGSQETDGASTPIYTPAFDAVRPKIGAMLRAELNRMGLHDIALALPDALEYEGRSIQGEYGEKLISLALTGTDIGGTFDHEAVHAIKELGLFDKAEWSILSAKAAKDWRRQYDVDRLWDGLGLDEDGLNEEAIAEAYRDWSANHESAPGIIARIFNKVRDALSAIKKVFTGEGFKSPEDIFGPDARDIFGKVADGEVGARPRKGEGESHSKFSPGRDEPAGDRPVSEKQFYKEYVQHIDLRGRESGKAAETRDAVLRDGFKKGANVNAVPPTRAGETGRYIPRKGDVVYLAPKGAWKDAPNGPEIQNGWMPKPYEAIHITDPSRSMYENYVEAFNREHAPDDHQAAIDNAWDTLISSTARKMGWEGAPTSRAMSAKAMLMPAGEAKAELSRNARAIKALEDQRANPLGTRQAPIQGDGETKVRGAAQSIADKAAKSGINLEDLPTYDVSHQAPFIERSAKFDAIPENRKIAEAVAMGMEPAPHGTTAESMLIAVERRANREGDGALLLKLATKSKVLADLTTAGQRISMMQNLDPLSPVAAIKAVQTARESAAKVKGGTSKAKKDTIKEMMDAINKRTKPGGKSEKMGAAAKKLKWQIFVHSITCS